MSDFLSHTKKKSRRVKKLFCQAIVRCEFYSRNFFLSTVWSGKNVEEFFCIEIYNPIHHTRPWALFTFLNIFSCISCYFFKQKRIFLLTKNTRKIKSANLNSSVALCSSLSLNFAHKIHFYLFPTMHL